jgi:hypothetical protein
VAVKLSSKLPDYERNGMGTIGTELVHQPERRHVVIAILDCAQTVLIHTEAGPSYTPTAGILYIEPIKDPGDVEQLTEIMARVRAERMGEDTLDFDLGLVDAGGE